MLHTLHKLHHFVCVNHLLLYPQFLVINSITIYILYTGENDGENSTFIIVLSGTVSGGMVIVIIGGGICLLVIIIAKKTRTRPNGMCILYS